jgi:O-antigen ligase
VMVCFVPLLLIVATTGSRYERIFAGITLLFALDSIVNTYERTGFVAVAAEFALLFFLGGRIARKLAPLAIIVGLVMVVRFMPSTYVDWISTMGAPTQESSASSRLEINKGSLLMFKENPFGVGYRNYPYVAHRYLNRRVLSQSGFRSAHNGFLSILCETGFIGFIAWTSGFIGAVSLLRRLRKSRDASGSGVGGSAIPKYALALEIGLYGWFVNNLTQADHEVDPAYWFVALAIIMTRLYAMQIRQAAAAAPAPVVAAVFPRRRAAAAL